MTGTLKAQLESELNKTLRELAQKTSICPPQPSPSITITPDATTVACYKGGKLTIPQSIVDHTPLSTGKLAGLVLQYHGNTAVRQCSEQKQHQQYDFWSQLAMTYAGLVNMLYNCEKHHAYRQAERIRLDLREKSEYRFDEVGTYYATKIFLKYGDSKLADVLTMGKISDVHAIVPALDCFDETARTWDDAD